MAKTVSGRPAPPPRPPPSPDRGMRSRDAILDTVGDLMSPHGYIATSHRDDLRRARLPVSSLYRHLGSRTGSASRCCNEIALPALRPGRGAGRRRRAASGPHPEGRLARIPECPGEHRWVLRLAAALMARTVRSAIGKDLRDLESHAPAQPALTPSAEPEICPVRGCSGAGCRNAGGLASGVAGRPSRPPPPRWPAPTQRCRHDRRPRPPRTLQ